MLGQTFLIEREESSVYIINTINGDIRKNCPSGQILNPSLSSVPDLSSLAKRANSITPELNPVVSCARKGIV